MSEDDERDFEDEGEAEPEGGLVTKNPIGEYYGARNDKNERHGRGRAALPNGDIYLGCYYRGQRHGLGVYRYKNGNGARYGGDWVFGEKQGWGTFYFPDGSQYTGNWDRGIKHGWGVYVYPNGDEYEGWWYRGKRNGRGIYRTKKTNEKFVGHWILGQRQGQGMLIRKHHRFIGNWYNDVPKGPGVYIFPKLRVEQHGKYTLVKIPQAAEEKWKSQGYQVRNIRSAPPPRDPVEVENDRNAPIGSLGQELEAEDFGESTLINEDGTTEIFRNKNAQSGSAQKPGQMANPDDVLDYMRNIMSAAAEADEDRIPVVPVWRAIQITGLMTEIPDESVPPPPMPPTPQPPIEKEIEEDTNKSAEKDGDDGDDPVARAKTLAKTHKLGPTYLGDGVCQPSEVDIRFPEDARAAPTYSSMSLSEIDEFRMALQAMIGQLEPLDLKAVMAANANLFKTKGMEMAEQWRPCLADDENCNQPGMPIPPDQHVSDDKFGAQVEAPIAAKETVAKAGAGAEMNRAEPQKAEGGIDMKAPAMPHLPTAPHHDNIHAGDVPHPGAMDHMVGGQHAENVQHLPQLQQPHRMSEGAPHVGEFKPPMEADTGTTLHPPGAAGMSHAPDPTGTTVEGQRRASQNEGPHRLSQNEGQHRLSQNEGQRRVSQNADGTQHLVGTTPGVATGEPGTTEPLTGTLPPPTDNTGTTKKSM